MLIQTDIRSNKDLLTESQRRVIETFLSKKRWAIVFQLHKKGRLSHSELAKEIDTSRTSLSNILLKFEQFARESGCLLLDSESEGKRRYYFLSELAEAYVQDYLFRHKDGAETTIIRQEAPFLMRGVKDCLEGIQNKYEKWHLVIDDVLIATIESRVVLEEEKEKDVRILLNHIERILLSDDENLLEPLTKLISTGETLEYRFEQFFDLFGIFRPLLNVWQGEFDKLAVSEFITAVIKNDTVPAKRIAGEMMWNEQEYSAFSRKVNDILQSDISRKKRDLYLYFNRILADEQTLSVLLVDAIMTRTQDV